MPGSFEFIYETGLGEVGLSNDYFIAGSDPKHNFSLWVLFILSTFVIIIHMMNMLVAIMTNSFEENQEVQDLLILRTKLRFIIESFDMFDPFEKDE